MNITLQQLHARKSTRAFTEQPIAPEHKAAILAAAVQAPTAGNQQLYTIIDVTDPALQQELVKTCDNQAFIATGKMVLIDCGANAECSVEYLVQFAYLGSFYASRALGLKNPRVGLLNIGAEDTKGDQLRVDTYKVLREAGDAGHLNFIGNIEAKDAIKGGCDVLVADGFSGNVLLKTVEGMGSFLGKEIKGMFMKSLKTKVAALMMKSGITAFKDKLDPDSIGGTPFLGLMRPVIKAHGSSGARAIENAIYQAVLAAEGNLAAEIESNIDLMKMER